MKKIYDDVTGLYTVYDSKHCVYHQTRFYGSALVAETVLKQKEAGEQKIIIDVTAIID